MSYPNPPKPRSPVRGSSYPGADLAKYYQTIWREQLNECLTRKESKVSELTGEQVDKVRQGFLRSDFNRALIKLIGRDLDAGEIERTEAFLQSFKADLSNDGQVVAQATTNEREVTEKRAEYEEQVAAVETVIARRFKTLWQRESTSQPPEILKDIRSEAAAMVKRHNISITAYFTALERFTLSVLDDDKAFV